MRFIALSKLVKQERGIHEWSLVGRQRVVSAEVRPEHLTALHGEREVKTDLVSGLDHA